MRRIAFAFASVACTGQGWQAPLSIEPFRSAHVVDSQRSNGQSRIDPLSMIAMLLLDLSSAAGFQPSGIGAFSSTYHSTFPSSPPSVSYAGNRIGRNVPVMKRVKKKVNPWIGNGALPTEPLRAPRYLPKEIKLGQGKSLKIADVQGLHIMSGEFRGRRLRTPDIYLRPMMSCVREALMSMLRPTDVFRGSAACLDLYAGSGCVGLECLSNGIGSATFVDFSPKCTETIRQNAERCKVEDRVQVVEAKVEEVLDEPERFGITQPVQLVTVCPPYEEVIYADLMDQVLQSPAVGPDTLVVVEYPVELGCFPPALANATVQGLRNRRYGRTVVAIYVNKPTFSMDVEPKYEEFVGL